MKKKYLSLFLLFIILCSTCSLFGFASPTVYPVYSGTLSYISGQSTYTPVVTLSGSVDFWLNSYESISMTENSFLLNAGTSQLIGEVRHSSGTYDIRIPAGADYIEVYQLRSGVNNSYTYFDYYLRIEQVPSTMTEESSILLFLASFVVVLVPFIVIGRYVL